MNIILNTNELKDLYKFHIIDFSNTTRTDVLILSNLLLIRRKILNRIYQDKDSSKAERRLVEVALTTIDERVNEIDSTNELRSVVEVPRTTYARWKNAIADAKKNEELVAENKILNGEPEIVNENEDINVLHNMIRNRQEEQIRNTARRAGTNRSVGINTWQVNDPG